MTANPQAMNTDARTFEFGQVVISVATQAGPRIVGYSRKHGLQLFASLPGTVLSHPDAGVFRFLGGHRLWRSPEIPVSTYHPDGLPVEITATQAGLTVKGKADLDGIVKTLSISPNSTRNPRTLTCSSFRPKNSKFPSARHRTRSPVL